jgi:hypothetical protein
MFLGRDVPVTKSESAVRAAATLTAWRNEYSVQSLSVKKTIQPESVREPTLMK